MEKGGTSDSKTLNLPTVPLPVQIVQTNAFITSPEVYKMLVASGEAKISSSYFKVRFLFLLS